MSYKHDDTQEEYIYHGEAWSDAKQGDGFYMFLIERGKYEEVETSWYNFSQMCPEPPEYDFVPYEAIVVRPRLKYLKRG